jgi:hypothetical protein
MSHFRLEAFDFFWTGDINYHCCPVKEAGPLRYKKQESRLFLIIWCTVCYETKNFKAILKRPLFPVLEKAGQNSITNACSFKIGLFQRCENFNRTLMINYMEIGLSNT